MLHMIIRQWRIKFVKPTALHSIECQSFKEKEPSAFVYQGHSSFDCRNARHTDFVFLVIYQL